MWQYQYTDELYHHGVPGQRWGVRRYQNADGTLTPAGRRKANRLAEKYAKVTGKKLVIKKTSVQGNEKPKKLNEMSDQEIQSKINRMRLEDTYMSMVAARAPKKQVSRGRRFISNIKNRVISPALIDSGRTLLTNFITKKGNDLIYGNNKNKNKTDSTKEYEKKVKNLELQSREWKAKNNIQRNKKQYEDAIKKATKKTSNKATKSQVSNDKSVTNHIKKNVVSPALTDAGKTLLSNYVKKVGNDMIYAKNKRDLSKERKKLEKGLENNLGMITVDSSVYKQIDNYNKKKKK